MTILEWSEKSHSRILTHFPSLNLIQNFAKMASLAKRPKADNATAADAPRPVGTGEARPEALHRVYESMSSWDELEALLNEDIQQCVITGKSSAICSSVT